MRVLTIQRLHERLEKAGPYYGPRGGKWADPKHTIPWQKPLPKALFHSAPAHAMHKIKDNGLSTSHGGSTFSHGAYGSWSRGKVFLSEHFDAASNWHGKVEDMLEHQHDDERKHRAVMLRVKPRRTQLDKVGDKDVEGSRYSTKSIPPDELEYHDHEHGWRPIEHWEPGRDTVPHESRALHPGDEAHRTIAAREQEAKRREEAGKEARERARAMDQHIDKLSAEWKDASKADREAKAKELLSQKSPIPGLGRLTADWQRALRVNHKGIAIEDAPIKKQVSTADVYGMHPQLTIERDPSKGVTINGREVDMPASAFDQAVQDLGGRVVGKASDDPAIDAVVSGKAELLGKGDDGLAFKHGDQVVKVSTVVPYNPMNRGYRTPEYAVQQARKQYETSKALREAGVPNLLPETFTEHDGRGYTIKPHVEIPKKLTRKQLEQVHDTIEAMHAKGYALRDQIQVGTLNGKAVLFDIGKADKTDSAEVKNRDLEALEELYRANKQDYVPRGGTLSRRWEVRRRMHSILKPKTAAMRVKVLKELTQLAEAMKQQAPDDLEREIITDDLKDALKAAGIGATQEEDPSMVRTLLPPGGNSAIGAESGRPVHNGIARHDSAHGSTRYLHYESGKPVAGLQVVSSDGKNAKIANVYVSATHRRQGLASKLYERAKKDFAVEHAADEDTSSEGKSWRDSLKKAIATFDQLHAAADPERKIDWGARLRALQARRDPDGIENRDLLGGNFERTRAHAAELREREELHAKMSASHKYISKKPDGKGGWLYTYPEDKRFKISRESVGAHSGQIDMISRAHDASGKEVGSVSYSIFQGKVAINMVDVSPDHKRKGVATAMYDALAKEHGAQNIETFGGTQTKEGASFRERWNKRHGVRKLVDYDPKPLLSAHGAKIVSQRETLEGHNYYVEVPRKNMVAFVKQALRDGGKLQDLQKTDETAWIDIDFNRALEPAEKSLRLVLTLSKAATPPSGFMMAPHSTRGAYRKKIAGKWVYWYPDSGAQGPVRPEWTEAHFKAGKFDKNPQHWTWKVTHGELIGWVRGGVDPHSKHPVKEAGKPHRLYQIANAEAEPGWARLRDVETGETHLVKHDRVFPVKHALPSKKPAPAPEPKSTVDPTEPVQRDPLVRKPGKRSKPYALSKAAPGTALHAIESGAFGFKSVKRRTLDADGKSRVTKTVELNVPDSMQVKMIGEFDGILRKAARAAVRRHALKSQIEIDERGRREDVTVSDLHATAVEGMLHAIRTYPGSVSFRRHAKWHVETRVNIEAGRMRGGGVSLSFREQRMLPSFVAARAQLARASDTAPTAAAIARVWEVRKRDIHAGLSGPQGAQLVPMGSYYLRGEKRAEKGREKGLRRQPGRIALAERFLGLLQGENDSSRDTATDETELFPGVGGLLGTEGAIASRADVAEALGAMPQLEVTGERGQRYRANGADLLGALLGMTGESQSVLQAAQSVPIYQGDKRVGLTQARAVIPRLSEQGMQWLRSYFKGDGTIGPVVQRVSPSDDSASKSPSAVKAGPTFKQILRSRASRVSDAQVRQWRRDARERARSIASRHEHELQAMEPGTPEHAAKQSQLNYAQAAMRSVSQVSNRKIALRIALESSGESEEMRKLQTASVAVDTHARDHVIITVAGPGGTTRRMRVRKVAADDPWTRMLGEYAKSAGADRLTSGMLAEHVRWPLLAQLLYSSSEPLALFPTAERLHLEDLAGLT